MWICRWWHCGKGKICLKIYPLKPSLCPSLFRSDSAIYKPISNPLPLGRRNRMKTTKTAKEKLAGLVRVISIPPVMVTALLLILYFWGRSPSARSGSWSPPFCCWALCRCWLIRRSRCSPATAAAAGRSAGAGVCFYRGGVYHSFFCGRCWRGSRRRSAPSVPGIFSRRCSLPCATACFTGAPAGTCSAAGPLLFLIYYFGWWMLLPSIVIGWLVAWASVAL